MKRELQLLSAMACATSLSITGCANLSTVDRSTEFGKGRAIHLDAPQRLTLTNADGWACAEPSPDALQAYASSIGLGYGALGKDSASVSQALSASSGSIGLRTQSITLMRDALYRICEMYFNKGISKEAAIQLLQRSQDMSMGILAIEQLTGAVVGQQVTINTNSAASAAAAINDTTKELERAKSEEAIKATGAEKSQAAADAQKKVVAEKTTIANSAKKKAAATQAFIDGIKPAYDKATTDLAAASTKRTAASIVSDAADASVIALTDRKKALPDEIKLLEGKSTAAKAEYDAAGADDRPALKIAWDAAKKAEENAKAELAGNPAALAQATDDKTKGNAALVTAKSEHAAALNAWTKLDDQLKVAHADPDQVAADTATASLQTATEDYKKKQDAADEAKKAYEKAQANTIEIAKLGSAATTNSAATGSGAGSFSTQASRQTVSADTVKELAKATLDIVNTVVNKGHLTDTCAVLLMSYVKDPVAMREITPVCAQVIAATLEVYRQSAIAAAAAPPGSLPIAKPAATLLFIK